MKYTIFFFLLIATVNFFGQDQKLWHDKERTVRYLPEGNDIVIENGDRRFTRALYGTNTAFRVEAGDLPEFAMYMPGMGGNLRFGLINALQHKWLINAKRIKAIYRAGSMIYEIEDALLGKGRLFITVLALSNAEGMIVKIKPENIREDVQLVWVYGGASGKKFSRDGDVGADPESSFYLKAENCTDNRYQLLKDKFILSYGTGKVLTEAERYEIQIKPESELTGEIPKEAKMITGYFPSSSTIQLMDASDLNEAFNSSIIAKKDFCVTGKLLLKNKEEYFLLHNTSTSVTQNAEQEFKDAETARQKIADRIKIKTPDAWLNTLGGVLSVAADAIWEDP